jgi:hypothetical protein
MHQRQLSFRVFAFVLGGLLSASCRRDVSAAEGSTPQSQSEGVAAPAAASKFDEAAFSLEFSRVGAYSAGNTGLLRVELKAKAPHHVNQEYPHKLKLKPVDGVEFETMTFARDSMSVEPMSIVLRVPVKPSRAGQYKIQGDFAFSLCTADRCLIEKRTLQVDIQAQ